MPERAYIRHPVDVPIELSPSSDIEETKRAAETATKNVSLGGLSVCSKKRLEAGSSVNVRIPLVSPPFQALARVVWCVEGREGYEAGVEFTSKEDAFAARMVEQICHIEHYRLWVEEVEDRSLSSEEAAVEWISKYAEDFPALV